MITRVARDTRGAIVWIKGKTKQSPLTYREFKEGEDMQSGTVRKDNKTYYPPFRIAEENI